MTNGEKIQSLFPNKCPHVGFNEKYGQVWIMENSKDVANFILDWWNAEYREPTTRNCFGCKYAKDNHNSGTEECHLCMWENQYTPTTKNNLAVDDEERELALMYLEQIKEDYIEGVGYERHPLPEYYAIETAIKSLAMSSVTPQLSVPEDTALAEWTEKLTKASENTYNKGYADGMKAQAEPKKGHWDKDGACPFCGYFQQWEDDAFCGHCGAQLGEVEE